MLEAISVGAATVLLRHDLPDGSWHVDWMLAKTIGPSAGENPNDRDLITFRLAARVDELGVDAQMPAERIDDHRRAYLEYEGTVSGDRGRVTRLARGLIEAVHAGGFDASLSVDIRWFAEKSTVLQRLVLAVSPAGKGGRVWIVRCVSRKISAQ